MSFEACFVSLFVLFLTFTNVHLFCFQLTVPSSSCKQVNSLTRTSNAGRCLGFSLQHAIIKSYLKIYTRIVES